MHSQQNNFPSHWQVELQPALGHREIKATLLAADFHILHIVKAKKVPRYGRALATFSQMFGS